MLLLKPEFCQDCFFIVRLTFGLTVLRMLSVLLHQLQSMLAVGFKVKPGFILAQRVPVVSRRCWIEKAALELPED